MATSKKAAPAKKAPARKAPAARKAAPAKAPAQPSAADAVTDTGAVRDPAAPPAEQTTRAKTFDEAAADVAAPDTGPGYLGITPDELPDRTAR